MTLPTDIREETYISCLPDNQYSRTSEMREIAWCNGMLGYKLNSLQLQVRDTINNKIEDPFCNVMTFVNLCCRQFGKSYMGVVLALEDAIRNPGTCIYIFGPQKEQAMGIVSEKMKEIGYDAPEDFIRPNERDYEWYIGDPKDESVIRVHGLLGQGKESRRGFKGHSIYFEETRDIPSHEYQKILGSLVPLITHSRQPKIVHNTTMPYDPNHKFMLTTVEEAKNNGAFFSFDIDQIPEQFVSKEHKRRLIHEIGCGEGMDSPQVMRELYNIACVDKASRVIPGFIAPGEKGSQVKDVEVNSDLGYMVMGDLGYTSGKSKTIFHIIGYDVIAQKMMIFDEVEVDVEADNETLIREVTAVEKLYISGEPVRFLDTDDHTRRGLSALGFHTNRPDKRDKDSALKDLRIAIANGQVEIHSRCELTVKTFLYGQTNNRGDHKYHDVYGHNDAADSIKMAWRHRHEASRNVDGLITGTLFKGKTEESNHVLIGVSWQNGSVPSYFTALNTNGELVEIVGHRGYRKDRIMALEDFVSRFDSASLVQASENVSTRMQEALNHSMNIESISLEKQRTDLWLDLRDQINDGDVCISSYPRIEREFNDSMGKKSDDYPLVDSLLLANFLLSGEKDRQEKIARGNMISLTEFPVMDLTPDKRFLGLYCDSDNLWSYAVRETNTDGMSVVTDYSDKLWISADEMMESLNWTGIKRVGVTPDKKSFIQDRVCPGVWVHGSDVDKLSDSEMLAPVLEGKEYRTSPAPDDYVTAVVLYPDTDFQSIVSASRLAHAAAVEISMTELLLNL